MHEGLAGEAGGGASAVVGGGHLLRRPLVQVLLVLLVCACVHWPRLGASPFASSEGHRVEPSWEMLDGDDWLVPRLFGRPYLRKPPGINWAIAGASAIGGRTETSARAVSALSATLGAMVVLWYSRRWFGAAGGLTASLAAALMPALFQMARSAEIEATHNLGVILAGFGAGELLCRREQPGRGAALISAAVLATGVAWAGLSKGPAAAPCLAGLLFGACVASRSLRPLSSFLLWGALLVAGAGLAVLAWTIYDRAGRLGDSVVYQGVGEFMWTKERLGAIATMPFSAFASALPASLGLLVLARRNAGHADCAVIARTFALASLFALAVYVALGVSNPRYVVPAMLLVIPAAGYGGRLAIDGPATRNAARALMLGAWWVWPLVLTAGGIAHATWYESRRNKIGGREAAAVLADAVPTSCEVWADAAVEARPDVLMYMALRNAEGGRPIRAKWVSLRSAPVPPGNALLVLREDPEGDELSAYRGRAKNGEFELDELARSAAYKYAFVLVRIRAKPLESTP